MDEAPLLRRFAHVTEKGMPMKALIPAAGLGTRFLRHIERNSVLLFMIPADSDDIRRDYDILLGELTQYNPELLDKERLLAVTKCDMLDEGLIREMRAHLPEGVPAVFISSVSGLNIRQLKDMLWEALQR